MVLSTVCGGSIPCCSMTGNCAALAALADELGYAQINTSRRRNGLVLKMKRRKWGESRVKAASLPARRSATVRTKAWSI